MKNVQSPGAPSALPEILLSTMAVLVAMAVVLFPSYSGLYGATRRAEQSVPAAVADLEKRGVSFEQADPGPRRTSLPPRSFMSLTSSSQRG
jgi:hypothetical protein